MTWVLKKCLGSSVGCVHRFIHKGFLKIKVQIDSV